MSSWSFGTGLNVQVVAGSIPAQVALIYRAWELMEHRYELIESGRSRVADFEPLFVVLDEYAEFVAGLSEWYPMIKVRGVLASLSAMALMKARTARQWRWRTAGGSCRGCRAMVFRVPAAGPGWLRASWWPVGQGIGRSM